MSNKRRSNFCENKVIDCKNQKKLIAINNTVEKVIELLKDKEKRQQLGQAGRELVRKKYDWQKIGEKLNQVCEKEI